MRITPKNKPVKYCNVLGVVLISWDGIRGEYRVYS